MGKKCKCGRLSPVAFGISLGVISGLFMMLAAWLSWTYGWGTDMVNQWSSAYPGFSASLQGGFVGLAWGFLEGFIFGLIWGLIYNFCLCCCRCCCCKSTNETCATPRNMNTPTNMV